MAVSEFVINDMTKKDKFDGKNIDDWCASHNRVTVMKNPTEIFQNVAVPENLGTVHNNSMTYYWL